MAKADIVAEDEWPPKIGLCLSMVLFLALLSPQILHSFSVHFIPSGDWVALVKYPALLGSLAASVVATAYLYKRLPSLAKLRPDHPKRGLVCLFAVTMLWFAGYTGILVTVPMAYTKFFGGDAQLSFIVSDPNATGPRGCRASIKVEARSVMQDDVCGFPQEFREKIYEGDELTLFGLGSNLGIFYSDFELGQRRPPRLRGHYRNSDGELVPVYGR